MESEQETITAPVADELPAELPQETSADDDKGAKSVEDSVNAALDALEDEDAGDSEDIAPKKARKKSDDDGKTDEKADAAADKEVDAETDDKDADAKADDSDKDAKNDPPSRFSADAKEAWAKAPKAVQAEIHRAISEMEAGLAEKDARLEPIKDYIDMIEGQGQNVRDVLDHYSGIENLFRQDAAAGFRAVAQNLGMTPEQAAAVMMGQQQGQADPRDAQLMQMAQHIQALEAQFGGLHNSLQEQQVTATTRDVENFAASHERFNELAHDIAELLQTGYANSLEDAYEKADRLNPLPPQPVAPKEPTPPPAQTRRAVTGAPTGGSTPTKTQPVSIEDAVDAAFNSINI